jgi:ribonuclease HI
VQSLTSLQFPMTCRKFHSVDKMNITRLIIATDACCKVPDAHKKGHSGKGQCACGVIFLNGQKTPEAVFEQFGLYLGEMTVNEAEYYGLITALEKASRIYDGDLEVWLDSELVVMHLTGRYKLKAENLKPLVQQVKTLERRFKSIRYFHHPREEQIAALADKAANQAFSQAQVDPSAKDKKPPAGDLFG